MVPLAFQREPVRDDTEDRDAQAREEIRALFERYRQTGRRLTVQQAERPDAAAEPKETLALTAR